MAAHILSVNIARPAELSLRGQPIPTGIFKEPTPGVVPVHKLGLAGDKQADLRVHGGPRKAVYAYPAEHYAYWTDLLGMPELPWGMFGENLTVEGLHEESVSIGDLYRAGTALLEVTQPREPCYKLALKFGRPDMVKRFAASGRSGFYFSVREEGELQTGDAIELVERGRFGRSIARTFQALMHQE